MDSWLDCDNCGQVCPCACVCVEKWRRAYVWESELL